MSGHVRKPSLRSALVCGSWSVRQQRLPGHRQFAGQTATSIQRDHPYHPASKKWPSQPSSRGYWPTHLHAVVIAIDGERFERGVCYVGEPVTIWHSPHAAWVSLSPINLRTSIATEGGPAVLLCRTVCRRQVHRCDSVWSPGRRRQRSCRYPPCWRV